MRLQTTARLAVGLALLLSARGAPAQGIFENLGFESAKLVPVPGDPPFYDFAQAFPGWTGHIGGVQGGLALSNRLNMDSAGFSIIDHNFSNPYNRAGGLIEGNYTAVLMSGISGINQQSDTTMGQTGLVPAGTESLWFKAHLDIADFTGSFGVTLGGDTLSLIPVQSGTNYTLYAADIHAWAGQTAELDFTVFANHPQHGGDNYLYLDSIQFSDQRVPEPGVLGLLGSGALLLGWRVLRRRR